jgi:thioredoxin
MSKKRNQRKSTKKRRRPGSGVASRDKGGAVQVKSRAAFERYLEQPEPVIVDFWAEWCGPCKMMAPIFDRVAREFEGKVRFLKVDTERVPELSEAFGIRSIPTLIVMQGEEVVDSNVGLTPEGSLRKMAQKALDRSQGVTFTDRLKRMFSKGQVQVEL